MDKLVILILLIAAVYSEYNQQWAIVQAKLSVITHCTTDQIQNWNCKLCKEYPYLRNVTQIQNDATQISGYIGYDSLSNTIVIAWRGSQGIVNWIEDLNFKLQPYTGTFKCPNCKIHQGFYGAYQSVATKVKNKVLELVSAYPDVNITITGHSLGGALSQVTALYLYKDYPSKIKQLYNFGSTRLGNGPLASFLHLIVPNLYRVVHYKDLVPHYPPVDFQYLHPPFEVFYNEQLSQYKICDQTGEDKSCSDKFRTDYNFNDHTFYWVKTDSSVC